MSPDEKVATELDGRRLTLSNLGKVLYPTPGFTKGEVISYYLAVAPVLLPHLARRPVTFVRYPDGVDGQSFFEKRVPKGAPEWVGTISVPRNSRAGDDATIDYPAVPDRSTLVWAANLAALELHVPLWRTVHPGEFGKFDQMVFDLDPGLPATIVECCQVAGWLVEVLTDHGCRQVLAKTSGSKGLQLYVPLDPPRPWEEVREIARAVAVELEHTHPELVVSKMSRELRGGKVFIDWSQNLPSKTTVAVYSLRAREYPTVSTPVALEEVAACAESKNPDDLRFLPADVLDRVQRVGDLFAVH